jgi:hypothetical protein
MTWRIGLAAPGLIAVLVLPVIVWQVSLALAGGELSGLRFLLAVILCAADVGLAAGVTMVAWRLGEAFDKEEETHHGRV